MLVALLLWTLLSSLVRGAVLWKWHTSSEECVGCSSDYNDYDINNIVSSPSTPLCSTNYGTRATEEESAAFDKENKCVSFTFDEDAKSPFEVYTEFFERIGDNAMIFFVGDSNTRHLYYNFLRLSQGHDDFITNLNKELKSRGIASKYHVDHSNLCPVPYNVRIGNTTTPIVRNLTAALIWSPRTGGENNKYWHHRPWSQCGGCEHSAEHRCDDSGDEMAEMRWKCGNLAAEINVMASASKQKRKVVVFNGGSAHDLYHIYKCIEHRTEEELSVVWKEMEAITRQAYLPDDKNMVKKVYPCYGSQWFGGKEIILSPTHFTKSYKFYALSNIESIEKCNGMLVQAQLDAIAEMRKRNSSSSSRSAKRVSLVDGYTDLYSITSPARGAPSAYDGIHYPPIVYQAAILAALRTYNSLP
jgi:hypothetical protein